MPSASRTWVAQRPRAFRTAVRLAARFAAPTGLATFTAVIFARRTGLGVTRLTGCAFFNDRGANILNSSPHLAPPFRVEIGVYAAQRHPQDCSQAIATTVAEDALGERFGDAACAISTSRPPSPAVGMRWRIASVRRGEESRCRCSQLTYLHIGAPGFGALMLFPWVR
jgi:hypothetical protein